MENAVYKCLALYKSTNLSIDFKDLFRLGLKIFEDCKVKPNYIGITGKGYPKKIVTYSSGIKKLEALNFNNLESINLIFANELSGAPAFDWLISFRINLTEEIEFFFGGNQNYISNISIEDLIVSINRDIIFDYGYVFYRENFKKPEFYVSGISAEGISQEETESITKWMKDSLTLKSYRFGKLRDLYDVNIITETHLNYPINSGTTLKRFIQDRGYTYLKKIGENLYAWTIPKDFILNVRNELSKSDIMICYNRDVYPTSSIS